MPIASAFDLREWHRWCKLLPKVQRFSSVLDPVGRFTFYAIPRNTRRSGRSELELREGVHGIRNRESLTAYKNTLEKAYEFFVAQGRPEPTKDKDGRVPVYVFAVDDADLDCGSPCTDELLFLNPSGCPDRIVPVLALPSRCAASDAKAEEVQARAAAVHELSHLFNARFLPYRRLGASGLELLPAEWIRSWLWLDEGIAVAAEAEAAQAGVLPGNSDWLGFGLDWVDRPDRSLDDPRARYQSTFFVRYVKRLMTQQGDSTFLNRTWQMAETVWHPIPARRLAALAALKAAFANLTPRLEFCSASEQDVFASRFCFDSYFLNDPASRGYESEVYQRFKERAITRTWAVRREHLISRPVEQYPLAGLACRYFRVLPGEEPCRLVVRVAARAGHSLKAELGLAARDAKRYVLDSKVVGDREAGTDRDVLVCRVPLFSRETCDHAVLVVTNCMYASGSPASPPCGHTQRDVFSVEALRDD